MKTEQGFTRVDLMAVVVVISLFAMIGAARIGAAGNDANSTVCISNKQQLLRALHLYTSDNGDYLPFMGDTTGNPNWLAHDALTLPDTTNAAKLINPNFSQLARYLNGNALLFKCPADTSTVTTASGPTPRVRSVSMNHAVGTDGFLQGGKIATAGSWLDGAHGHTANKTFRTYARLSDVVNPRPSSLYVFLDEHPVSINDGAFACMGPRASGTGYRWIDWCAGYHNGGGSFGFADGHGEIHSWLVPPPSQNHPPDATSQPDQHWLATHTSALVTDQP